MNAEPRTTRILHAREVSPELARAWCDGAIEWFGSGRHSVAGAENLEHLAQVETPLGPAVAKLERPRGWKRALVQARARPLRAVHAFQIARELESEGQATPTPLAAITHRSARDAWGVLLTRQVQALDPWSHVAGGHSTLEELLDSLARALARLHASGFRHRDLKVSNILARPGHGGSPRISWTDLDGLTRPARLTDPIRLRDLARLCASFETAEARAAGLRAHSWPSFLTHYDSQARSMGLGSLPFAEALGRTHRWARRHVERNLIRGRPVT